MSEWSHFSERDDPGPGAGERHGCFAPFFSSTALPARPRRSLSLAVAFLLAPLVAALPNAHAEISFSALLGEIGGRPGLRTDACAAERDASVCRANCRRCNSAFRWSI